MKKQNAFKLAGTLAIIATGTIFGASVKAESATGTQEAWTKIENPQKNVPAKGEYAVLISNATAKDLAWNSVAETLLARYAGTKILWDGEIETTLGELQKVAPRYVAIVAKPEEIDRVFVAQIHAISRRILPDFYGDAICGIITGTSAQAASKLAEKEAPLVLNRGFGTTNFDQQRFKKSCFITDWNANEFVETENYISGEKTNVPAGKSTVGFFAEQWEKIQPQYILTASHATEFNLEMPFGKGLIASTGDNFYLFQTVQIGNFIKTTGNVPATKEFATKNNLPVLAKSENSKIWIAAGNCLIGDASRNAGSMVVTALSIAGVKQFVGYTVPTWFGAGGWGTHSAFFNNHQDASVGEAWFFNNQSILERLPEKLRTSPIPITAAGNRGIKLGDVSEIVRDAGISAEREIVGLLHDRDVVAFYGDPLYRAQFDSNAKSVQPWNYELFQNGKMRKLVVTGTQNRAQKGKFNFWFPQLADTKNSAGTLFVRNGNQSTPLKAKKIFTQNFLMFLDELELPAGSVLEFFYTEN